jgi:hypothetical protein
MRWFCTVSLLLVSHSDSFLLSAQVRAPSISRSRSSHYREDCCWNKGAPRPSIADGDAMEAEPERTSPSLEEFLSPSQDCDVSQLGPTALAYLGDVVFELFVRSKIVWPPRRTSDLQDQVVSLVRGENGCSYRNVSLKARPAYNYDSSSP